MKTLDQIKERGSKAFDGRDFYRLAMFIPESQLADFGITLKDEYVGKLRDRIAAAQGEVQRLREELHKIAAQCSCEETTDRLDALLAASTGQEVEK